MNDLVIPGLILSVLALAVMAAGLLRSRRTRRALRQRQVHGIQLIRLQKRLMGQIQEHRGLVSVLLNGNPGKHAEVVAKQVAIQQTFRVLKQHDDEALATTARMRRICDYWEDIESQLAALTAPESFDRHSALIRQILFLIGDTADHSRLHELSSLELPLTALWSDLPATAEAIGQARAVGAGVAAAEHCDSVARIKLRYLHQRVEEALRSLEAQPALIGAAANTCPSKIELLLTELEQHLLLPSRPTITAEHYYKVASEAMGAVYGVFEQASERLEKQLLSRAA